jgi:thiol-disulfide isomerase/thioredoxin
LPIGAAAPPVKLPDLSGAMVDLAEHRGTRTLVLFWNPGCGFCQRMLPDLKAWEAKTPKGAPKLVLVSSGTAEENREQGLRSPILLDQNFSVGSAFGTDGTPSAVMIDAHGRIASELAVGGPAVMKLARSTKDPVPQPTRV